MTEPLDRPIWHALTGRQASFALGAGLARRFRPDVSPFTAWPTTPPAALAAVAALAEVGEKLLFLQRDVGAGAAGDAAWSSAGSGCR